MNRMRIAVLWLVALLFLPLSALSDTRALLIACSDFVTQPDLGSAISGNLHMIGSALISADMPLGNISIEDGTIGTADAFASAVINAFGESDEDDLSLLYLCTHGILSSADDGQVYLLLGDGTSESPLSSDLLYDIIKEIQGEKLLILDACFSGALIGRGSPERNRLSGIQEEDAEVLSPFLLDPSIHVLTSASGEESGWYYDSDGLQTGAVSYFASALSSGLGLYGMAEADMNSDGCVTLAEIHRYLSIAVPSSSSQLLSANADLLTLPVADGAMISRPLTGFSYETSLLFADDPTLYFSFTVTRENTSVQYRLIDFDNGSWDWENAKVFLDSGDTPESTLTRGRKNRALSLEEITPQDSGYLMLQVFSVTDDAVLLCSERLIAVQPTHTDAQMTLSCSSRLDMPGVQELPVSVHLDVPAELSVSVYNAEGMLIRRLASSQLTRPSPESISRLYWDGRDAHGFPVPSGCYTVTTEAMIGAKRQKAAVNIMVGS